MRRAYEHLFTPDASSLAGSAVAPGAHPAPAPGEAPPGEPFDGVASRAAAYRSSRRPREHPYRAPALRAMLLFTLATLTWTVGGEVLQAIERSAAVLAAAEHERWRAVAATGMAAAGLLALIVAWSRATAPHSPVRLAEGRGTIAVEAIAARLRAAIETHPDVLSAEVWVDNHHRRGLSVEARLHVAAVARIDDAIDAVDAAVEEWVLRRLGVPVEAPPLVDVTYDELDLRAGRAHG